MAQLRNAFIIFSEEDEYGNPIYHYCLSVEKKDGKPILVVEDGMNYKSFYVEMKEIFHDH